MKLIDLDLLKGKVEAMQACEPHYANNFLNDALNPSTEWECIEDMIDSIPVIDAQPVKHGQWSECYRDSRCISVICSVCKNPTVIAHGCRDTDEVTMDDVIEKLPNCPKCCSDMRGDADETE